MGNSIKLFLNLYLGVVLKSSKILHYQYGITYIVGTSLEPVEYMDADFSRYKTTRKWVENIFLVAGGLVLWERKRQDTVALLTIEADSWPYPEQPCKCSGSWIYLEEVRLFVTKVVIIYVDNNGAISFSLNSKNHHHTKHIDIQQHFTKEHTKANDITFQYTPSSKNLANFLTKLLPRDILWRVTTLLGLIS